MDIKYNVLCEWVRHDLVKLEHIDTSVNMAHIVMKQLGPTLANCHIDYLLGHASPQYSACFKRIYEMAYTGDANPKLAPRLAPRLPKAITSHPAAAAAAKLFATWSQVVSMLG